MGLLLRSQVSPAQQLVFVEMNKQSNSFFDRTLRFMLKPLDLTPEELARRLGVIPTIIGSAFVRQTSRLYDYIGTQPGLGRFLNVGWWERSADDWEPSEAFSMTSQCETLVRRVGDRADLDKHSRLLDVGFGYGEQDRIFLDDFNCGSIVGLNITASQVEHARNEFADAVDRGRFLPHVGDAVKLPYAAGSFNRLIALESPFHFHTRKDFLEEAYRVLESEGKMVVTDIINGRERGENPVSERLFGIAHNTYWQVDRENHCTVEQYRDDLESFGFREVSIQDVTDRTLTPGITRYIRWRTSQQPAWLRAIIKPAVNWALDFYRSNYLRYVIVAARK